MSTKRILAKEIDANQSYEVIGLDLAKDNVSFPTLTLLSTKNRCKSPITWVFSGFNVFTLRSYHSPARSRIPFIFSFSDKACLSS